MSSTAERTAIGALDPRPLAATDPEVARAIDRELERQRTGLELIASENFVSRGVLEATGSVMTNKYSRGLPGASILRRVRVRGRGGETWPGNGRATCSAPTTATSSRTAAPART